jgi:serine/threonine protein kinase
VHKCELDGQTAVAKVIDSSKLNEEMTYLLTNECTIWARVAHPHIVSFFGMASTPAAILLVCEYFPCGGLNERLEKLRKQRAPAPDALDLIEQLQQIATGMEYLHALQPPVLHRDLKSANVLIAEGGQRLAIADFGLARYQANPGKKMTAETGSYRWMAPEVIRHEEYDKRCDVYSFAILAWEMLTYRVPFDNMSTFPAPFRDALSLHSPLETA